MIYDIEGNSLQLNFQLNRGQTRTVICYIACVDGKKLWAEPNDSFVIEALPRAGDLTDYTNLQEDFIDLGEIIATQPEQLPENLYQAALFSDQVYIVQFAIKFTALSDASSDNLYLNISDV